MRNPINITLHNNAYVEIGDPFILRFNGKYYLYCSTCDDVDGVRLFTSAWVVIPSSQAIIVDLYVIVIPPNPDIITKRWICVNNREIVNIYYVYL